MFQQDLSFSGSLFHLPAVAATMPHDRWRAALPADWDRDPLCGCNCPAPPHPSVHIHGARSFASGSARLARRLSSLRSIPDSRGGHWGHRQASGRTGPPAPEVHTRSHHGRPCLRDFSDPAWTGPMGGWDLCRSLRTVSEIGASSSVENAWSKPHSFDQKGAGCPGDKRIADPNRAGAAQATQATAIGHSAESPSSRKNPVPGGSVGGGPYARMGP